MKSKKIKILIVTASVLVLILLGALWYVGDYYRADESRIEAFISEYEIDVTDIDKRIVAFGTGEEKYGFVFYPGGKVEASAYLPLLYDLASKGIFTVLCEMPCNLAVLDVNAADGICEKYPDIQSWYIGGHSLGGSMAASYAEKNTDLFDGVILLGSYSTADLSSLRVLSIYGSEDKVMNREKYELYRKNLPEDLIEAEIKGGCHAYFGMYGEQSGDGVASVDNEKQIIITANSINEFILRGELYAKDN